MVIQGKKKINIVQTKKLVNTKTGTIQINNNDYIGGKNTRERGEREDFYGQREKEERDRT